VKGVIRWTAGILIVGLAAAVAVLGYVRATGLRADVRPGSVETRIARAVRSFAVSAADRNRTNPVAASADAVAAGRAHFADHCASCHANDGSGETELGRGMYPPPPDMRLEATQRLTDGEIFHVIEHGIRFTGMPGFATGDAEHEAESWQLVHFIRHLPKLSAAEIEEMLDLNPRPAAEIRQEIEEERFLRGEP
jgi:mono/diheme cytochrome c family protein